MLNSHQTNSAPGSVEKTSSVRNAKIAAPLEDLVKELAVSVLAEQGFPHSWKGRLLQ